MRTSINIRVSLLEKVDLISEKKGLSRSEIINLALKKFITPHAEILSKFRNCRAVEYQQRGGKYIPINVIFDYCEYNLNSNFRLFCRYSVSFLIAMALELYLDTLFSGTKKHNYVSCKYEYRGKKSDCYGLWVIHWKMKQNSG